MNALQKKMFIVLLGLTWAGTSIAQSTQEDDLAFAYGDKSSVSIATGTQQSISRAPAVATVITAQDIRAMGARDLDQALESVPGLHVSYSASPLNPIYSFRGIFTGLNPQVLMLVNGLPITNVFAGNRSQAWGGMPVENVARIEIIRGPGSALYGADAFSGVINVITKTAEDIDGTEFGADVGTYRTSDVWVQHGGNLGPLAAAFYLRIGHTDGQDGVIEKDSQSSIDQIYGTHASLAPAAINAVRDALDARADLSYERWRLRTTYQKRKVGIGTGLADSLDPDGRVPASRLYTDLSYQNPNWAPNWDVSGVVGYYDIKEEVGDPPYMLFPAGAFGGTFPDGVIGNAGHSERHTHASVSAFYTGFAKHRLRMGTGFRIEDLYQTSEFKNFTLVNVAGVGTVFVPLGGIVNASGNPDLVFMRPHKRQLSYVFAQDEWSMANDWTLTAGVRHDRYSDFGGTTNPRLALIWDAAYNLVIKAMHGRAFRAPNFVELYNINNPVNIGNPGLRPETIATDELAFSWQPVASLHTDLSLFQYRMSDIIRFVANADPATGSTAQNSGNQKGHGLELEATWDATRSLRLSGSVSLQRSTDEATDQDAGLAPHRRYFGRADWRFAPLWQIGTTINHVADRKRQPGDLRSPVPDYTTMDIILLREKWMGGWDVSATVSNVFNRDAREPTVAPGNIPFDLPLPGRAFYVKLEYKL